MHKILCLNKISPTGTKRFGENYTFSPEMEDPEGILVRSASMHDMELPASLLAIARAGAGTNNIPAEDCAKKGVVVFNTPGANANAVKELVLCALLLSSRKIVPSIDWVKTLKGQGAEVSKLVEKGKGQFAGPEIMGKTLGVVGLGAIGILVANAAHSLGMEVYGYDPFLSVDAAWRLSRSVHRSLSLDEIYQNCDYITLHLPETPETKNMINAETLAKMKDGVRIVNLARGGLVDSAALLEALASGKSAAYAPPGGLYPGERGQLRPDGRGPDEGVPGKRQHHQLCESAQPDHGPGARHSPHLRHPPERARSHCHLYRCVRPAGHQHREHAEQVPGRVRLHHFGCNRRGGLRRGPDPGEPGGHYPGAGDWLIDNQRALCYNGPRTENI